MKYKKLAQQLALKILKKRLENYQLEFQDVVIWKIASLSKEEFCVSQWIPEGKVYGNLPTIANVFHYPEGCFYLDQTSKTFEKLLQCYQPDLKNLDLKEFEFLLRCGSPYVAILIDSQCYTHPVMVFDSVFSKLADDIEPNVYSRWYGSKEPIEKLEENFSLTEEVIQFLKSVPEGEIVLQYPDMLKTSYLPDGSLEFFLNTTTEDSPDRARVIKVIITPDYKVKTSDIGPGFTLPGIA